MLSVCFYVARAVKKKVMLLWTRSAFGSESPAILVDEIRVWQWGPSMAGGRGTRLAR